MKLRKIQKMNKKGDVTDIIVFLLIITFLAISFIVVLLVNDSLYEVIEDTALNESDSSSTILSAFDNINDNVVQRGFVLFFGILIIGILISGFLVRIHPAFLFLYIIMLAFTLLIAVYMGNLYDDFTAVDELNTIATGQPMINFIMQNIVKIVLAVGALSMIIIFSKLFSSPGGGGGTADL